MLFSSGTQSKHQAWLGTPSGENPQTFSIQWPPQGPGSKYGTTRKGRWAAMRNPSRNASPEIIFGVFGSFVSSRKSISGKICCLRRSAARQSTKYARLYFSPTVADLVAAIPHLDFPACHVGEDQHVGFGDNEGGAGSDDQHLSPTLGNGFAGCRQFLRIEEVVNDNTIHPAKNRIIAQVLLDHGIDFTGILE